VPVNQNHSDFLPRSDNQRIQKMLISDEMDGRQDEEKVGDVDSAIKCKIE
jgi:hypothetical protein